MVEVEVELRRLPRCDPARTVRPSEDADDSAESCRRGGLDAGWDIAVAVRHGTDKGRRWITA